MGWVGGRGGGGGEMRLRKCQIKLRLHSVSGTLCARVCVNVRQTVFFFW